MNIIASGRFWLAGHAAFLLAIMVMLGMATWFPKGAAEVDNLILPMISFPLIWSVLFFYAYLERSLKRVGIVVLVTTVLHVMFLFIHFSQGA